MSGKGKRPAGDKDGLDGGQVLGKAWAKKYFKITGTAAKCSVGECTTTLKVERGNTSAMARHIRGQQLLPRKPPRRPRRQPGQQQQRLAPLST
jgi:hypothetical protein